MRVRTFVGALPRRAALSMEGAYTPHATRAGAALRALAGASRWLRSGLVAAVQQGDKEEGQRERIVQPRHPHRHRGKAAGTYNCI